MVLWSCRVLFISIRITKDVYDKKQQELADQLQRLEMELAEHRKADFEYQTVVSVVVTVARQAKSIFDKSSEVAEKRAFIKYLLQNPTVNGKKLYFSIASPFNLILDLADNPILLPLVDKFRTINWSAIKRDLEFSKIFEIFSEMV